MKPDRAVQFFLNRRGKFKDYIQLLGISVFELNAKLINVQVFFFFKALPLHRASQKMG